MAAEKHSPAVAAGYPTPESEERREIALDASYEIEALASDILEARQGDSALDASARAVCIRMHQLCGVIMSALGDEVDTLASMRRRLSGLSEVEVVHG